MNKAQCLYLGIDTSNYTTSVALCDGEGRVVLNLKRLLSVKQGERGLRQSDALFAHTKNLPELMDELNGFLSDNYPDRDICAVGYSARPRDAQGSYMPCFLAGVVAAKSIAAAIGCPSYDFSHQTGHITAALYSAGRLELLGGNEPFAAFHGVERLHGASVESVDLRAGAAIVIAGLVADGTTEVTNIYTIERGYLDIVGKLKSLGADISKIYIDENAFI